MDSIDNSSGHHHFLLLGERHVSVLIRTHQAPEIEIANMGVCCSATATKNIIGMRLFDHTRGRLGVGVMVG